MDEYFFPHYQAEYPQSLNHYSRSLHYQMAPPPVPPVPRVDHFPRHRSLRPVHFHSRPVFSTYTPPRPARPRRHYFRFSKDHQRNSCHTPFSISLSFHLYSQPHRKERPKASPLYLHSHSHSHSRSHSRSRHHQAHP